MPRCTPSTRTKPALRLVSPIPSSILTNSVVFFLLRALRLQCKIASNETQLVMVIVYPYFFVHLFDKILFTFSFSFQNEFRPYRLLPFEHLYLDIFYFAPLAHKPLVINSKSPWRPTALHRHTTLLGGWTRNCSFDVYIFCTGGSLVDSTVLPHTLAN